jgi:hypothetical protein
MSHEARSLKSLGRLNYLGAIVAFLDIVYLVSRLYYAWHFRIHKLASNYTLYSKLSSLKLVLVVLGPIILCYTWKHDNEGHQVNSLQSLFDASMMSTLYRLIYERIPAAC